METEDRDFPDKIPSRGKTEIIEKETDGEPRKSPQLKAYKRRWYILCLFCLYSFSQACVWNTFGPISSTAGEVLGWKDADIALLSNWGPIAYISSFLLFSWMLNNKGLRWACVVSALLVMAGTALRCITMQPPAITWLVNVGHLLNGWGGPVAMGAAPHVSAVWFPLQERTTATALGTASNYFGVAAAFLLDIADIERERNDIAFYMYVSAGWCLALFVTMVIYFPKKPPLPPCASAAVQREDFLLGLKHLLTRQQFWLVAVVYGVSLGVLNCWASLLNVNISSHGISEKEAGWIGFYATVSGCVFSLIVARFADMFARIMKQFIIGLYICASVFFLVFALAVADVIASPTVIFYVTIIGGTTLLNSAVPLIFELACELAYPTGEGTTNVVLTTINNVGGLLFLFVGMIPNIGSVWMNWTLVVAVAACLPVWLLLKENYNRLAVDETNPTTDSVNTEITVINDHTYRASGSKEWKGLP